MAVRTALSYSSVRTYLECALRWKFLYVDQLPEAPRGYFSFGRTVHSVLEELLRPLVVPTARLVPGGGTQKTLDDWKAAAAQGRLPSREEMLSLYDKTWVGDGYTSPEEEARYRTLGAELLTAYHVQLSSSPPTPIAVEAHLEAKWDGVPIHGYIDRIDRRPTGGLEILDYKTSRELSGADARESDQLSMYQVLVEQNYPEPVERLTLFHLRSLTPHSAPARRPAVLETVKERVVRAGDGIRAESYEPSPGRHCSRCEFKSMCPEFRLVPEGDRTHMVELVDRFQRLRADEERLERDLRQTAEELHRAAERLGVHRVPGTDQTAVRRREELWRFHEPTVLPLLEELGLTGRARPDDPEAIHRLTQDKSVNADARRRLAEAGARQVRWYWVLENGGARS